MIAAKTGDRINNYILEEMVGAGSFAQVWRARHHVLDEIVAVKILTDPQYLRNFRQEGVVVHGLRHPNIVRTLDIDPYNDMPYMVMEFVDGPSLRKVIDDHPQGLPIDAAVRILRGMLTGLQAAHAANLVHRDVKPANTLLRLPDGRVESVREGDVKLADFGLGKAAAVTTASLMQSGSLVTEEGRSIAGTLVYMSPEQRSGEQLDGRSDLYSCAVVLFEMLTGSRPAGSDLPSMVRPETPSFLDDVFRRSYTRLERRFASAEAMLEALNSGGAVRGAEETYSPRPPVGRAAAIPAGRNDKEPAVRRIGGGPKACHHCGGGVRDDDNFCIHCGRQLVSEVPRCPSCRSFVNRTDRFCIFCGGNLRGVQT